MSESTAVAIIENIGTLHAATVFAPGGVDDLLTKLKAEVRAIKTDVTTPKGRAAIKSLAYNVARSKTALDDLGKDLVADIKAKSNVIDAERRRIRDELDALRDEVRKPVDDFEAMEDARVHAHEDALADITRIAIFVSSLDPGSIEIEERLKFLDEQPPRDWQEYVQKATDTTDQIRGRLTLMLAKSIQRETEQVELARLREESAERERQEVERLRVENERRIAAEAAEAARIEAEAEAARKAEEVAAAQRAEVERIEREAAAERERANAAAAKAEDDRIRQHEFSLGSLNGMISDACSPFNNADTIRHISDLFEKMAEHGRDWQEFAGQYESTVAEGRKRIAERLAVVEQEEAERAEADRIATKKATEQREEAARIMAQNASRQAEIDQQRAIEAERKRVADQKAAEEAETKRREADKAHRGKINSEAHAALVAAGIPEDHAKAVIIAVAKGLIAHISIRY